LFVTLAIWLLACPVRAKQVDFEVTAEVDLGKDVGQNFGMLFEVVDTKGNAVAGAGYVGSYNTQSRSDRRALHFFLKPAQGQPFEPVAIARPSADSGTYLYGFQGRLFSKARGGNDHQLKVWNAKLGRWNQELQWPAFSIEVADGRLSADAHDIRYRGQSLLTLQPDEAALAEHYYANGHLIFRHHDATAEPPLNELVACPWTYENKIPLTLKDGCAIPLGTPREFVYAYGQLHHQVVAATNTGGIYVYDGNRWSTLLEPDVNVSFQIYAMLNYGNELLMGQYPTGELFSYDGKTLKHLSDWPPAMPGVQKRAREAQTLTLYGGDLYVGVWPWGEIWKYGDASQGWQFQDRMFTHPAPTDATTHPYETETKQAGGILNRWGQRVTSLVPLGNSLFISTSSKGGYPFDANYPFLSTEKAQEYGKVYQVRQPGALVVPTRWKDEPTRFTFRIQGGTMTVSQDGKTLGTATAPATTRLRSATLRWGQGIFGPLRGKIVSRRSNIGNIASTDKPQKTFLGAYINMQRWFDPNDAPDAARTAIDNNLMRFQKSGLNVLMPYCTTSAGQASYPSALIHERTFPSWDPLAHFVARARQCGLEVWPVVCVLVCGTDRPAGILTRHPDWAMRNLAGEPIGYISPGHPAARQWIVSVLSEIARQYQPDGILLDYLRYHNRPIQLDAFSMARFEKTLAALGPIDAKERAARLQTFRETLLTELMEQIHSGLHQVKPNLKLAIYRWGPHVITSHRVGQDWQTWVERGYLDMLNISGYLYPEQNGTDYLAQLEQKLRTSKSIVKATGRPIPVTFALGVRTSHGEVHSARQISSILQAAQRAGSDGVAFYTWDYLQPWLDAVVHTGAIEQLSGHSWND